MRVAMTTTTAFGHQNTFARFGKIVNHLAGFVVVDDSSNGHRNFEVFTVAAMLVAAFSVAATISAKRVVETKFQKGVFVAVRCEIDAATIAAVTTAGAAFRDELFPAECNASVTSVAGLNCDFWLRR